MVWAAADEANGNDENEETPPGPYVVVVPVEDMIDDGVHVLVERAIRDHRDAEAILFAIDTPGGRVDSAVKIAETIQNAPIPTIAYITGGGWGAISAGALVSFACDDIAMAPGSSIGAAAPVIPGAGGMQPAGEKEVSFLRARMRGLAESKGHNPDIAEAMVDPDIELRARLDDDGQMVVYRPDLGSGPTARNDSPNDDESPGEQPAPSLQEMLERFLEDYGEEGPATPGTPGLDVLGGADPGSAAGVAMQRFPVIQANDQMVLESGKLLTLTASEAQAWGLIEHTPSTVEQAVLDFGYEDARIERLDYTWSEALFRFLVNPTVAGLLLMAGMGGLYFEVRSPGFGLPGIIGISALALFFGARYVIGLSDWLDLILVALGLGLIIVELFVLPGFGIFGITGAISLLVGLYLALTNVPIPEYSWDFDRLRDAGMSLTVAFLSYTLLAAVALRVFPHTPAYRKLVLNDAFTNEAGYTVEPEMDVESSVGMQGKAVTMLRPAGRGRFGGKTYSVVTRGDYIDEGAPIRVVEVRGNRYVVVADQPKGDT